MSRLCFIDQTEGKIVVPFGTLSLGISSQFLFLMQLLTSLMTACMNCFQSGAFIAWLVEVHCILIA
jgi:hypothetical protein